MDLCFHDPHFHGLIPHQDLDYSPYAQPLKQAQGNHQTRTQKDSLNLPFDL